MGGSVEGEVGMSEGEGMIIGRRFSYLILILIVLSVYANALNNGFVSDDQSYINPSYAQSPFWQSMPGLRSMLGWVTIRAVGAAPWAWHLPNILFHAATVCLLFALIREIEEDFKLAFIAAALFAVHPICVESVTWISGGPYVMGGFFGLMTIFCICKSYNLAALFFYLAAVFLGASKMVILPLMPAFWYLLIRKERHLYLWSKRDMIGSWVLLGLMVIVTINLVCQVGPRLANMREVYFVVPKMMNPLVQIPIAITSYLELLIWPHHLSFYHSEMVFTYPEYWARAAIFAVLTVGFVYACRFQKAVAFWMGWFFISLLTTLTPFGISWVVAERYVYFGAIAFCVLLAAALCQSGRLWWMLFLICLIAFGTRTWFRNRDWKTEARLWFVTDQVAPHSSQNQNNMGSVYMKAGRWREAEECFKRSIAYKPRFADAWHNLGMAVYFQGRNLEAVEYYKKALSINPAIWQAQEMIKHIVSGAPGLPNMLVMGSATTRMEGVGYEP